MKSEQSDWRLSEEQALREGAKRNEKLKYRVVIRSNKAIEVIPHSMRDPEIKRGSKVAPLRVHVPHYRISGRGSAELRHTRFRKCSPPGCFARFKWKTKREKWKIQLQNYFIVTRHMTLTPSQIVGDNYFDSFNSRLAKVKGEQSKCGVVKAGSEEFECK